ncbi:MAG: rRNA pseudouridine synthase [Alphaproteobacteria bacterium]|nr:rRNA pseudouridine synthase [Alphaproteobacteria bacterium]MBN2675294.1 rRNA pseudouridine synthase [Alphaproteobacteria bacterium]
MIRIAKFLADSGMASRRAAERLIESGVVTVNNVVITSPVFFVDGSEEISVSGRVIESNNETKLYAFYKPINTMTTASDPEGRKTIYDILPQQYNNLKYIGRLDYKTTGLLLLTNDGELARKLTLPSSGIPRVYIAKVEGDDFSKLEPARSGINVDGINYRPMNIEVLENNELKITITEGKKNEIRIVLAACNLPVKKLHRISYGTINLENISVGEIIEIPQKSIDVLKKSF